jgi:hypothetical protein
MDGHATVKNESFSCYLLIFSSLFHFSCALLFFSGLMRLPLFGLCVPKQVRSSAFRSLPSLSSHFSYTPCGVCAPRPSPADRARRPSMSRLLQPLPIITPCCCTCDPPFLAARLRCNCRWLRAVAARHPRRPLVRAAALPPLLPQRHRPPCPLHRCVLALRPVRLRLRLHLLPPPKRISMLPRRRVSSSSCNVSGAADAWCAGWPLWRC